MTRVPFHPLLFAILPVLSMFAANPGQRSANELTDSLWIVLGAAVVLLLVAAAVYRELRKAALAGLRPVAGLVAAGRRRSAGGLARQKRA